VLVHASIEELDDRSVLKPCQHPRFSREALGGLFWFGIEARFEDLERKDEGVVAGLPPRGPVDSPESAAADLWTKDYPWKSEDAVG
jgi:hypothetical protein